MKSRLERMRELQQAVDDSKKFIHRAEKWINEIKKLDHLIYPSVKAASCKRTSMDLTRSLAKIRKS